MSVSWSRHSDECRNQRLSQQCNRLAPIWDFAEEASAYLLSLRHGRPGLDPGIDPTIHVFAFSERRCGDGVMDATLILIDSDAELARARALVERLWSSDEPRTVARLEAQARLIAAYEER